MPQRSTTASWYRSCTSASSTASSVSTSYQPWFASSQASSPVLQASSRTPAADSSSCTSISKRVRAEPYGPSSPVPTITTRSSGRAETSPHDGVAAAGSCAGDGARAATVAVPSSSSAVGRSTPSARARRSRSASPSPPVRSSSTGATAACSRDAAVQPCSSSADAISSGLQVRTPAASTACTSGSLPPMRPVPRTQPMMAWVSVTRCDQDVSAPHLVTTASSAAFASP